MSRKRIRATRREEGGYAVRLYSHTLWGRHYIAYRPYKNRLQGLCTIRGCIVSRDCAGGHLEEVLCLHVPQFGVLPVWFLHQFTMASRFQNLSLVYIPVVVYED